MTPLTPRVNTFMEVNRKPSIDNVSKFFIIMGILLGANRYAILGVTNRIHVLLMVFYSVGIYTLMIYLSFATSQCLFQLIIIANLFQFLFCALLAFVLQGRLSHFYTELNTFDYDMGIEVKYESRKCIKNYLQLFALTVFSIVYNALCENTGNNTLLSVFLVIMKLLHCFEMYFYGHVFICLMSRLKLITTQINLLYPNKQHCIQGKISNDSKIHNAFNITQKTKIKMKDLIGLYNRIIVAFEFLYNSIKWQMVIFIIITFSVALNLTFHMAKGFIDNDKILDEQKFLFVNIIFFLIKLLPLLVPCVYAEQVASEVRLLKDLLSSRLYENVIDKTSRSSARALLALIETQNLSVSLFHMFDIDIALPFKFLSLLLTYLIILLQFDKVINP